MRKYWFIAVVCLVGLGNLHAQEQEFQKIESKYFKNLYKVSDSLYRSEQPNKRGFRELEKAGVKTVINFRRDVDDARKVKKTGLLTERIPLKASEMTESHIIEVLQLIHKSPKPVLIHCWHGSDRTGIMTAAYRVVFEGWPKEKAVKEFRYPDFGYHEKWYPNLVDLIMDLDTEKIRRELGIN